VGCFMLHLKESGWKLLGVFYVWLKYPNLGDQKVSEKFMEITGESLCRQTIADWRKKWGFLETKRNVVDPTDPELSPTRVYKTEITDEVQEVVGKIKEYGGALSYTGVTTLDIQNNAYNALKSDKAALEIENDPKLAFNMFHKSNEILLKMLSQQMTFDNMYSIIMEMILAGLKENAPSAYREVLVNWEDIKSTTFKSIMKKPYEFTSKD